MVLELLKLLLLLFGISHKVIQLSKNIRMASWNCSRLLFWSKYTPVVIVEWQD